MLLPGCPCCGDKCSESNYTYSDSIQTHFGTDYSNFLAQSFITPPDGIVLTSVTMSVPLYEELRYISPEEGYENYPKARLYASESCSISGVYGIRPVSYFDESAYDVAGYLAALTPPPVESLDNGLWTFTHSGYSLAGNTRYFISLQENGYWQRFTTGDESCKVPAAIRTITRGQTWICSLPFSRGAQVMGIN